MLPPKPETEATTTLPSDVKHHINVYCISDIHLEHGTDGGSCLPTSGDLDVIVLAGDIGNPYRDHYFEFLTRASLLAKHVIVVTGNHEYYNNSLAETDEKVRSVCSLVTSKASGSSTIHFLQNTKLVLNIRGQEWAFLGCTLWHNGAKTFPEGWSSLNDSSYIGGFTREKSVELYKSHVDWLTEQLESTKDPKRTIVVTHHLPTKAAIHPDYARYGDTNLYFYSPLDELVAKSRVWFCGHTHSRYIPKDPGMGWVYVNPVGYPREKKDYLKQIIKLEG